MDSFVKNILVEWGMTHLNEVFEENEVCENIFKDLTDADIKDLIPKLGQRKPFMIKYDHFKNSINLNTSFLQDNDTSVDLESIDFKDNLISDLEPSFSADSKMYDPNTVITPTLEIVSNPIINNSVSNLLNSSDEGKMILKSVGINFKRNDLARFIIKHELNNSEDKRITTKKFIELSKLIVACFPHESESIYYIPYCKNERGSVVSARGKLWTCYRHQREKYKSLNMLNEAASSSVDVPVVEVSGDEKDLLLWLKEATEPFPDIQKAWRATFNSRSAEKLTLTIEQVLQKYKCLSHPLGYLLLQDDFKRLFRGKQIHSFVDKYTTLCPHLIEFAKRKSTINHLKVALQQFHENYPEANENAKLIFGLRLIPLLAGSSVMKFKNRTHWKPTKIEIQNGFLLCVDTVANLEIHLENLSRLYAKHNLTIQPLPVIVGNWQNPESYVVLNNIRYLVESPLAAFDLAFKVIYALDAAYPSEAESSWVFVQEGLYGISTAGKGRHYTIVKTLLADFKLS